MWLSLNIVSSITDISGIKPEDLAHRLTMSTAEIESIHYMNGHFGNIVTAKILDVVRHPNADKLTLVDLDTGEEKVRVVCGAPNHKKGDIVALAKTGTKFTEEFTVKKTKIRGEESSGMLCSEKELGLSEDHSGILVFPEDTPAGKPLTEIFPDWVDILFEIDNKSITHRPDLWSHTGFAREIATLYDRPFKSVIDKSVAGSFKNTGTLKVTIKCPNEAPRYSGLMLRNIKVAESPDWLKARVIAIGMRPINNIVDITNYVMAEVGEPMHAFDRKKLNGGEIIVRMAKNGEKIKTLDGQEHTLCAEDIVIADAKGAVALAGVMGGENSEIEESTNEIVLEAANFNPVNVRKTAHRYNLPSEASMRFEKSLSPELTEFALLRCFQLIRQIIPDAEAITGIIDSYPKKPEQIKIKTDADFIRKRLGQNIGTEKILHILNSLGLVTEASGESLSIDVPHYRATKDISIPEDIVEEVGRIFGFDNINPGAPLVPCFVPRSNERRKFERRVKELLSRDFNMTEVSGYSFIGEELLKKTGTDEDKELRLANPLSNDLDRLRRNLVPNVIRNIKYNHRFHDSFAIYELGRVYIKDDRKSPDLIAEERRVCGAFYMKNPDSDLFYYAKNAALGLLKGLKINNINSEPLSQVMPYMHPGRTLKICIKEKEVGFVFKLNPRIYKNFDISGRAVMFDINLDMLMEAEKQQIKFAELQKFPDVPFEISVLADKNKYVADIRSIIIKSGKKYIKSIDLVSLYEGTQIPQGMKSISFRIVFRAKEATLSPEKIDELQKNVINGLNKNGYKLR